jgi:hypothetical protein
MIDIGNVYKKMDRNPSEDNSSPSRIRRIQTNWSLLGTAPKGDLYIRINSKTKFKNET